MNITAQGIGFLVVRIVVGLAIAAHGSQKLLGWFGGDGLEATSGFFGMIGFNPGKLFALMASLTEISAGLLLVVGLGGPIGPALLIMVMIVGAFAVHVKNGFFAGNGGFELNVMYGSVAVLLAVAGMGELSLDRALGLEKYYSPAAAWGAIAAAIIVALANLGLRQAPAPTPTEEG